jgi:hypothetical protein
MSVRSQRRLSVPILFYCPREYHLRSRRWSVQFRSSYPNSKCCPWCWNMRKFFFPFWASALVVGPRRPSNEAWQKHNHETQSDSTRCYFAHARKEKWHGWPRSFPPSNRPDILCSTWPTRLLSFLVPPPFENLRTRFLLRGEDCDTPHHQNTN